MTAVVEIDRLVEANRTFAEGFDAGGLPIPPSRNLAILTCIDARMHPERFLGLEIGEAHVLRNAGGRASDDALRSLVISSRLLGTRRFAVIHHTDCGMVTFTNQELWDRFRDEEDLDATGIDFLPFSDLEQSVRDDVATIRENPFLPGDIEVSGWVYDVKTGLLEEVQGA